MMETLRSALCKPELVPSPRKIRRSNSMMEDFKCKFKQQEKFKRAQEIHDLNMEAYHKRKSILEGIMDDAKKMKGGSQKRLRRLQYLVGPQPTK